LSHKPRAPFIPAAEIAAARGCTPQTIRNYAREFGLGLRVAGRWVFPHKVARALARGANPAEVCRHA